MTLAETLKLAPVVPVLIIEDAAQAVPLAKALTAGGLYALEVTLRTPAALECIRRIAGEVEGAVVGAGTITTAQARQSAADAGAKFGVSPGLIDGEGQLHWLDTGQMPLPDPHHAADKLTSDGLLKSLNYTASRYDNVLDRGQAVPALAGQPPLENT